MDMITQELKSLHEEFTSRVFQLRLVDGVRRDWAVSWALLQDQSPDYAECYVPPIFPIKGQDLLETGMKPGKEVGQRLQVMRDAWVKSRFTMTKEDLLSHNN